MDKITKLPPHYAFILCNLYKKLVEPGLILLTERKIIIENVCFIRVDMRLTGEQT
jgi:hypothetical protein